MQTIFAVRSNIAVCGDSSPCSRCLNCLCLDQLASHDIFPARQFFDFIVLTSFKEKSVFNLQCTQVPFSDVCSSSVW